MQYPHRFSLSTNIRQAMCLPASFFWRRNRHVELLDTLAAADVVTEVMLRVPIRVYLVAFPFSIFSSLISLIFCSRTRSAWSHTLCSARAAPFGGCSQPFGSARSGKLHSSRSRLYRSKILQENMRLKALAEIYTMYSFAQLCNLIFCQNLPKICEISKNDF